MVLIITTKRYWHGLAIRVTNTREAVLSRKLLLYCMNDRLTLSRGSKTLRVLSGGGNVTNYISSDTIEHLSKINILFLPLNVNKSTLLTYILH